MTPEGVPEWVDRSFPVFFIVLGLISAGGVAGSTSQSPGWVPVGLVLLSVLPWALSLLNLRLPDPLFAAWVILPVGVLIVVGEVLDLVDLDQGGAQLSLMLVIGVVGQMAAVRSLRFLSALTAAAVGVVLAGAAVRGDALDFAPWVVGILLGACGGRAFRNSMVALAGLRQAQLQLAERRVADERRRIAREVHDIVAHTMSVTMLHLTAARLALDTDPQAARAALLEAEQSGRASMDDIRGVVRLLRTDETALDAALPGDADLPALVDRYRAAGGSVAFDLTGDRASLPPATRLALYRVVQESLSNAVRHGCGPVEVRVDASGDVEVEVVNHVERSEPVGRGTGLTGMRERIEALGGRFDAGPEGDRWRVHAVIPASSGAPV